tara:strand:- start:7475 stop:7708 length:234 start_codon:yes stop_codon:yes gene_type:complete
MKEPKFELSKKELNLIRFYNGLDTIIWRIKSQLEKAEKRAKDKGMRSVDFHKDQLKLMKGVEKRMNKFLYPEDYDEE